ncbi:MAG: adenosylcobinamide-GDP ribazoletransferase, partial [Pseudomonadota bacterium]
AAALLALSCGAILTGGLHEDGLADTADGFGGGRTITRKLEIMRDSRIGSYGVLALILVISTTAAAIETAGHIAAFVAIGAASRTAMLVPMLLLTPARSDGLGHGATLDWGRSTGAALVLTGTIALLTQAVLPTLAMLITALALSRLAQRQIGGQTGDVLGATQKVSECMGWLLITATAG